MAYAPRANMFYERESWRRPLTLSLAFHGLVVLSIFGVGYLMEPRGQSNWGDNPGQSVNAKLVSGAAIPIPRPEMPTENIVANENKGITQTPPQTKTAETEDGVTIPGHVTKPKIDKAPTKANSVRPQPLPTPVTTANNVRPRPMPTPPTAVAYGEGGAAKGPYSTFTAPNTSGGFSAQNADFGSKYGWYVDTVRRAVQNNWLLYEIDPHITAPHRAYVTFDILRDGTVDNIRVTQTSGVPTLDLSATRAVKRVDRFGALPEGSRQTFEFWFDYPPK